MQRDYETAMDAAMLAAQTILESSGETYRAEDTARRMSAAFGFDRAEILAFPTGFLISFYLPGGEVRTRVLRINDRAISLGSINAVNAISRKAACGELDAQQSYDALRAMREKPKASPWRARTAFGLSAGFFAVMFGGRATEFAISCVIGIVLQLLMPLYRRIHAPSPIVSLFSGAVAALCALILIIAFGGNQESIVAGSIMPLLPGIAMTNAIRDTLRGDLLSGLARGADALLSAIMLASGVAIVLML